MVNAPWLFGFVTFMRPACITKFGSSRLITRFEYTPLYT